MSRPSRCSRCRACHCCSGICRRCWLPACREPSSIPAGWGRRFPRISAMNSCRSPMETRARSYCLPIRRSPRKPLKPRAVSAAPCRSWTGSSGWPQVMSMRRISALLCRMPRRLPKAMNSPTCGWCPILHTIRVAISAWARTARHWICLPTTSGHATPTARLRC